MKFFSILALSVALAVSAFSQTPIRPELRPIYDATVLVQDEEGSGSGVIFRTKSGEVIVWTCSHVIWNTQSKPAKLIQSEIVNGRKSKEIIVYADVIAVSHPTRGYDLAILRPRDQAAFSQSATFFLKSDIPPVGTPVIHCGSPRGAWLERSITFGSIAGISRSRQSNTFCPLDQSTCTAVPGSSGGGIFLVSGELIGLVSEWEGTDNINFYVPVRAMLRWALEEKHPEWLGLDKAP